MVVRFWGAARVVAGCGAVVLVIRPDLVFPRILGCSTTAGAWNNRQSRVDQGRLWTEHPEPTYSSGSLAGLARVGLGLGGGSLLGRSLLGSSLWGSLGGRLIL